MVPQLKHILFEENEDTHPGDFFSKQAYIEQEYDILNNAVNDWKYTVERNKRVGLEQKEVKFPYPQKRVEQVIRYAHDNELENSTVYNSFLERIPFVIKNQWNLDKYIKSLRYDVPIEKFGWLKELEYWLWDQEKKTSTSLDKVYIRQIIRQVKDSLEVRRDNVFFTWRERTNNPDILRMTVQQKQFPSSDMFVLISNECHSGTFNRSETFDEGEIEELAKYLVDNFAMYRKMVGKKE
jgi:hypothetical protein